MSMDPQAEQRRPQLSPEHRAKISAALKGRKVSNETRAKIGASHAGLKHTAEARAKMSAARRRRVISAETRAKISAAGMGRKFSAETRAKISAANTGRIRSPEHCAKISASKKGKRYPPRSPEHCAKISAARKGQKHSPETRAKLSAAKKGGRFIPADLVDQVEPILDRRRPCRPEQATSAGPALRAIRLLGPNEVFYLDGVVGRKLRPSEYDVVKALVDAGPDCILSGRELREKSGRGGYERIIIRLRADPLIGPHFTGGGGSWAGYGLRVVREPSR